MTDDEMIGACLKGDQLVADLLVDRYWHRVFGFCFRLCQNRVDAEDLTQDVFLRTFKELKSYHRNLQFKAWLFRIATNAYFDHIRSRKMKHQDADAFENWPPKRPIRKPDESAEIHETVSNVTGHIADLPDDQRVAILLRVVERMEYSEIANVLSIQESTARWHVHEARRNIRQQFGEQQGGNKEAYASFG